MQKHGRSEKKKVSILFKSAIKKEAGRVGKKPLFSSLYLSAVVTYRCVNIEQS